MSICSVVKIFILLGVWCETNIQNKSDNCVYQRLTFEKKEENRKLFSGARIHTTYMQIDDNMKAFNNFNFQFFIEGDPFS